MEMCPDSCPRKIKSLNEGTMVPDKTAPMPTPSVGGMHRGRDRALNGLSSENGL